MFARSLMFAITVATLLSFPVGAQSGRSPCDDLAAFPHDPERVARGVPFDQIRVRDAARACENAVEDFPASGRLWFQYGRVLERGGQIAEAVNAYFIARRLGHAGGANNLGELHRQGKGLPRDLSKAEAYFREAADAGYPEGAYNLAATLLKTGSFDRTEVERLSALAINAGYPGAQKLYAALGGRPPSVGQEAVFRPEPGSPLRRELMNTLRPMIEEKLYAPIEFRVNELKVSGEWAFAQVMPQRPGGTPVRVRDTPMADMHELIGDDVHTEAILRRVRGSWRVVDYYVGSTDVWYMDWCDRLPKEIFGIGNEPGVCEN
jgi:hypothetical protein